MKLTSAESVEFSIRIANLIKSIATMIGDTDIHIISMKHRNAVDELDEIRARLVEWMGEKEKMKPATGGE